MTFSTLSDLQARVLNCLQTILDLEADLKRLTLSEELLEDFENLRRLIVRIDDVALQEQEVRRIEAATSQFLEELKVPLALDPGAPFLPFLQ